MYETNWGERDTSGLVPDSEERAARLLVGPVWKAEYGMSAESLMNSDDMRRAEVLSANVNASARGLAKMGAYMANRGTFEGKTIMSESSWNEFHSNVDVRPDESLGGLEYSMTNGGVATDYPLPGYMGWAGHGGSFFVWNPTNKVSYAYVPADLNAMINNQRGGVLIGVVD